MGSKPARAEYVVWCGVWRVRGYVCVRVELCVQRGHAIEKREREKRTNERASELLEKVRAQESG